MNSTYAKAYNMTNQLNGTTQSHLNGVNDIAGPVKPGSPSRRER